MRTFGRARRIGGSGAAIPAACSHPFFSRGEKIGKIRDEFIPKIVRQQMAASLLELVRQRRLELEALQPESALSDERRIMAILALAHEAALGQARCHLMMVSRLRILTASNTSGAR
jgi:hypothetical protein